MLFGKRTKGLEAQIEALKTENQSLRTERDALKRDHETMAVETGDLIHGIHFLKEKSNPDCLGMVSLLGEMLRSYKSEEQYPEIAAGKRIKMICEKANSFGIQIPMNDTDAMKKFLLRWYRGEIPHSTFVGLCQIVAWQDEFDLGKAIERMMHLYAILERNRPTEQTE